MIIKFDYQLRKSLSEHVIYIITVIFLTIILLVSTVIFFRQMSSDSGKINTLQTEIDALVKKVSLIEYTQNLIGNEVDLDHINLVLGRLLPSEEDYFSIIYGLEKLSAESNFSISSYSLPINHSPDGKLTIIIGGNGDPNSFAAFLNSYRFGSGRLVTVEKIEMVEKETIDSKITINVYKGKESGEDMLVALSEQDKYLIEDMLQKVQIEFKTEEATFEQYPTKTNPF